jgi:tetratricopeptide (TPR) repeat protein
LKKTAGFILHLKLLVGLVLLAFLVAACRPAATDEGQEIEAAPGAYHYSGGSSSFADLYRRASDALDRGEFEAAESSFREIIDKDPGGVDGYIGLGTSLFLQGRIDEAEDAYATALGIKPRSAEALIGLGSVHYSREEYSNAVDYYRSAVSIESRNVNALWGLAISLNELGLGDEALAPLQKIRELVPDSSLAEKAEAMMNAIEQP